MNARQARAEVTPRNLQPADIDQLLGPACLHLIDVSGRRYVWPMSHGSRWRVELETARAFYRRHAGVEIVTAVGR